MVLKVRTQSRFSFSVPMKRSAQPLPSGARTKAGELSIPRKASSFWKASDAAVVGTHGRTAGAVSGHPAEMAMHALAARLQRLEAGRPGGGMNANAFGRGVI